MTANIGGESLDEAFKRVRDLDASLSEQLRAFADASRKKTPDFAAVVDRLVERLRRHGVGEFGAPAGRADAAFRSLPTTPGTWSTSTSSCAMDRLR